ncbi:phosphate ABC transporter substrate-binding protein [Noviherbaspirillum galbum]|uniref:Phosphate ABC transporter substrate-binding protein n=1 Tax=Noviherbaspirillum galbum TaxID=2709383 RepID=A0A6B3SP45_9BURK|nr:phosphate ABC transporter substrate-binding protein [Noviherbaspirillum galbum]NEX59489.1 phosphate ABC transporter substrate-binding protein [Noviherbaspirillum galbum]
MANASRIMITAATLVALSGLAPSRAQAQTVVVVAAASPVNVLSAAQVANVFLGKRVALPGGVELVPLDQPEDSAIRHDFYLKVVGRSPELMKAHWSRLLFTGKGEPPRELPNGAGVRRAIAADPRYVGYLDKSAVDAGVKIVFAVD